MLSAKRSARWAALVSLSLVMSSPALTAYAGDPSPTSDEADRLKADADSAMDHNEFQKAFDLYERSYALKRNPAILYNEGRALQGLNRMPEALAKLKAFKSEAPVELLSKIPKLDELVASVEGKVCRLALKVEPAGASVRLGDRVLGKAPLGELEVNAGDSELEVSLDGYVTDTRVIPLPGKGRTELTITLTAKDTTGTLQVRSEVDGTTVAIDGKVVGQAPSETKLKAGEHHVVVSAGGHDDHDVKVVLKSGEVKKLDLSPIRIPLVQKPWFWLTIGTGVLATGATAGIIYALTTEGPAEEGTIPPYKVPIDARGISVHVPVVYFQF